MKSFLKSTLCLISLFFYGCSNSNQSISLDKSDIVAGEKLFRNNCAACHSFTHDGIGPNLSGITKEISPTQISEFIKNPKEVILSGNERAGLLYEKFKNYMPAFDYLKNEDLVALNAYINTFDFINSSKTIKDENGLVDPIPASISKSDLIVNVKKVFRLPTTGENSARTRLTKLEPHPNTDQLYMLDLNGLLYQMNAEDPKIYMDMAKEMPNFINVPGLASGFGSYAFHPDFENNGLLYTTHSEPAGSKTADFNYNDSIPVKLQWIIQEWKTNSSEASPFKGSNRELFRIDMVTQIHGMQNIAFNPTARKTDEDYGNLYIGIGDGGASESGFDFLAVGPSSPWSSIFRIDPQGNNSENGNYGIPSDNPFVDSEEENVSKEVFAHGFRNPHRFTWTKEGKMISSNIGHHNIESIYVIEAGHNYGWPYREGSFEIVPSGNMQFVYPLPNGDEELGITYSSLEYDHGEGNAVCGGFVYYGNAIPALKGKYLFGDIVNGRLFYAEEKELKAGERIDFKEWQIAQNGKTISFMDLIKTDRANFRMGIDHLGELYLFSKNEGTVYQLIE